MAVAVNKRSVMTLYSNAMDPHSHRSRIVLNEKNVTFEVVEVTPDSLPEDLIDLNPYGTVPTLVDRDLVLYDSRVIIEYLDERFPHPPLMPVDPVSRARSRLMLYRIENDWYSLLADIEGNDEAKKEIAKKEFLNSIISISPVFEAMPYFMSDDFTLVDCSIAPLLWRLPHYGIELPSDAKAIEQYCDRIFSRKCFVESCSEEEIAVRA